jgi:hypothetical protein
MKKAFTLGAVLTVLSGKLLCDLSELYAVLNFLTGEEIYTHQIPRAFRVSQPFVAREHPDLAALDWSGVGRETFREWLASAVVRFGTTRELSPLPVGAYEAQNPIEEAWQMRGEP